MREYIHEAVERSKSVWARPLFVSLLLAAAFGIGLAQGGSAKIAENAHMKINGNGWACNEGYREFGEGCMLEQSHTRGPVPVNTIGRSSGLSS